MFKKLILVLMTLSLLLIPMSISGCSKATPTEDETKSTKIAAMIPIAPEKTPELITPTDATVSSLLSDSPITVSEFIKNSLKNKYQPDEIISVSGTVLEAEIHLDKNVSHRDGRIRNVIILGPETSNYTATFTSEGIYAESVTDPGWKSFSSMTEVKQGNVVVIQGNYYANDVNTIFIKNASVVQ